MSGPAVVALVVLGLWGLSGCAPAIPLVPDEVFAEIASADRERNYDLAWQDIAALNGQVDRGELSEIPDQALLVAARMERLATGEPGRLDSAATSELLDRLQVTAGDSSVEDNWAQMDALGERIRADFDAGHFAEARGAALDIMVRAAVIEQSDHSGLVTNRLDPR